MINEANEIDRMMKEDGMSMEDVAQLLKKPIEWVKWRLELLKLEPNIQRLVLEKKIKWQTARVLTQLSHEEQIEWAKKSIYNWWGIKIGTTGFQYRKLRETSRFKESGIFIAERRIDFRNELPIIYSTGIAIYSERRIKSMIPNVEVLPKITFHGKEVVLMIYPLVDSINEIDEHCWIAKIY